MKPRKWHLVSVDVKTSKRIEKIIVATGPMPGDWERIEVTETGDASTGYFEETEGNLRRQKPEGDQK